MAERHRKGRLLRQLLADCQLVKPQKVLEGCREVYWHFQLLVQPQAPFTAAEFVQALRAEDILRFGFLYWQTHLLVSPASARFLSFSL